MNYARLDEGGTVVELLPDYATFEGIAEPVAIAQRYHPDFVATLIGAPDSVEVGDVYNGSAFSKPQAVAPKVPQSVTMRQARLALLAAGQLPHVQDAITALPSPEREQAQIEWDYATTVDREDPFTLMLAGALGLDATALDALFVQAAAL